MTRFLRRTAFAFAVLSVLSLCAGLFVYSAEAQQTEQFDLSDYRTVEQAVTTRISNAGPTLAPRMPGYLGIHAAADGNGSLVIGNVEPGSPAASAGLRQGDQVVTVLGRGVTSSDGLRELLKTRGPGEDVWLNVVRNKEALKVTATLAATSKVGLEGGGKAEGGSFDNRGLIGNAWKKPTYRLAIIAIEYDDVKHNPKITTKDWEDSMFSLGTYKNKSVTGQTVYGSMNDYYKEQSFSKLKVEGKMFDFVQVSKKRMAYSEGNNNKTALFNEACEKLLARDGEDALNNYDGVFFLYAGERPTVPRGSLYWPHRSNFSYKGKRWPYFIVQEGGPKMNDISVFCHEFGHMLGLPDLYARPEQPGSEGVGQWCAMSNQIGQGHPQHFSAWSKEQLGWITPCMIDPAVKQKLILAPIEDSPKQCFKVLVRPNGSEYYLLENRQKKGWDSKLPGEGLLVWRVVGNRPILEESHGVEGPTGPRVFLQDVPFPSKSNDAFTPYTIPSSRSQLGGGMPVFITNIHRLPDRRISFQIGYEYL